jgi:hypothetical protein
MLHGLADRVKSEATFSLRSIAITVVAALAAATAVGFLVAALCVRLNQLYGAVAACVVCAIVFVVIALVLWGINAILSARHRRAEEARRAAMAAATPSPLTDPRLLMIGFQIAQAIGFKRLLPLLAVGGAAFALVARNRSQAGSGQASSPDP